MALCRSHFQCGKCEGRRSQSSAARTPSLALPPRWARKEFCVVVCTALLTFVCMLRYWMWNVVPIWFWDSSVLMVVRCDDLVSGFFDIYDGTLCRSGPCILRYLWWYAVPILFLYSSILIGIFCTSLTFQDRPPSPLPSPACFFLSVGSVSQRKVASLNHIHLSKPQKHPRLHPLPERCLLPLASLNHIHLSKPQKHPRLHPLPERCLLPLASLDHIHLSKPQKTSPTASTPGPMPPSSGVPRPHPPNETSNVSPTASNAKSRRQKNLSHRHETPAFSFPGLPKKNKMYYTYWQADKNIRRCLWQISHR